MTIWRVRISRYVPKATNTHQQYLILIAFPLQQRLYERASVSRCTYIDCVYELSFLQGEGFVNFRPYYLLSPGSNPGGDEIFRLSRPALGPTQPPVKWVPGLSRGYSAAGACC